METYSPRLQVQPNLSVQPQATQHYIAQMFPLETGGPATMICVFAYGGIHPSTHNCLIQEIGHSASLMCTMEALKTAGVSPKPLLEWRLGTTIPPQDALIDRARAFAVKNFLADERFEVLMMIDHDIDWRPTTKTQAGDIQIVVRRCAELKAIVGGMVSKRVRGEGVAILWKNDEEIPLDVDEIREVHYVGAAFTAYHRSVLESVSNSVAEVPPGFRPIWLPIVVDHPRALGQKLHLSEDWALCHRAALLGFKSYASLKPMTGHHGDYRYTVFDSMPHTKEEADARLRAAGASHVPPPISTHGVTQPKLSLLHATRGRPMMAMQTIKKWLESAICPQDIEYIISIDDDDVESCNAPWPTSIRRVQGTNAGNVDAYNRAAFAAHGDVLIQVHDDVIPPKGWDIAVLGKIGDLTQPRVLHVADGTGINPTKPWLLTIYIATRAYVKRCGYFYHPSYTSLFCDDDISQKAMRDGVVVEATDLVFQHQWGGPNADATYRRSYSPIRQRQGSLAFKTRQLLGFSDDVALWGYTDG